jgi:toxin HigB-1
MIASIRNKALKRFWTDGETKGLRPDWIGRIGRVLDALDTASKPEELNLPGFGFHRLTGDLAGRYAVTVSRNWRITFGWLGEDAQDVDLEDYHG